MNALQRIAGGAATGFAVLMLAVPAYAGGSIKDKPEPRRCTLSANVGLTTDYVFRGISQTSEGPAIQGGFDATCGMFYAGVWASSLDWGSGAAGVNNASMELDVYAGVKFATGKLSWDLGVIYYAYPNASDIGSAPNQEYNFVEIKLGASTEVWKGGTVGVTGYYSPDYQYESGAVVTVEGAFSQTLPALGRFTPTFSALIGYQASVDDELAYTARVIGNGATQDHYTYWNAGVSFAFAEKWSLDVRYWDTSIDNAANCGQKLFACDERVVGTLKFTF